jgi:hypothetical protein
VLKNVQTLLDDAKSYRQLANELGGFAMRQALLDVADAAERAALLMAHADGISDDGFNSLKADDR